MSVCGLHHTHLGLWLLLLCFIEIHVVLFVGRLSRIMRTYKRKSDRGKVPLDVINLAAKEVLDDSRPVRTVAKQHGICHITLRRFVMKLKAGGSATYGYAGNRQIFTSAQERILVDYVKTASAIYFGLSPVMLRKLAFDCAVFNGIKVPESWSTKKIAGIDWLSGFLKRNNDLSVRTPEATSLARATSFNRQNMASFFDKLAEVVDRYKFEAADIWNFDETGLTTVQKPRKIVASKGVKQVGALTSAERGELITIGLSVSADGKSVPPMMIFPRKNYKDYFLRGAPVGSIGVSNPSGWMTETEFCTYIRHFVKYSRSTVDRPVLLLLDNHGSHLSIEAISYAKDHGVVMLSFPPHCSHKLQPLDRSVYGPFKKYASESQDGWLRNNPGKTMTIYDLPQIAAEALSRAASPVNIANGFKVAGIVPFDRNIFTDSDFAPSFVTDRPMTEVPEPSSVPTNTVQGMFLGPIGLIIFFYFNNNYGYKIFYLIVYVMLMELHCCRKYRECRHTIVASRRRATCA